MRTLHSYTTFDELDIDDVRRPLAPGSDLERDPLPDDNRRNPGPFHRTNGHEHIAVAIGGG